MRKEKFIGDKFYSEVGLRELLNFLMEQENQF